MAGLRVGVARLRALVLLGGSLTMLLAAAGPAQGASKPKIGVGALHAYPATVASGGTTSVSATVAGLTAGEETTCSLSAPKSKPVTFPGKGFSCTGTAMRTFAMPANKSQRTAEYKLTLTAIAANGKAKAKVKFTIAVLPEEVAFADKQRLSMTDDTSCAIAGSNQGRGEVFCWGGKYAGELGDGGTQYGYSQTPSRVLNIENAVELASGEAHTCALLATGHIKCWGSGIGLGENQSFDDGEGSSTPVAVENIKNAVQITAYYKSTCALLNDGQVECWGEESAIGAFGHQFVAAGRDYWEPTPIPAFNNAVEVRAARGDTCARFEGGLAEDVACIGGNGQGQLGDGAEGTESADPKTISKVAEATQLTAGAEHMCAVVRDVGHPGGRVDCWGWDRARQLGNEKEGNAFRASEVVAKGISLRGALQVSAGDEHTCALLLKGAVDCWGSDARGQLGDGGAPTDQAPGAVPVSGLTGAVEIAAGPVHSCALLETEQIRCWGSDAGGDLGDEKPGTISSTPVVVDNFPPVSAAARRVAARRRGHRKSRHKKHK